MAPKPTNRELIAFFLQEVVDKNTSLAALPEDLYRTANGLAGMYPSEKEYVGSVTTTLLTARLNRPHVGKKTA